MARLELDFIAKNVSSTNSAIGSITSSLSTLEKHYEFVQRALQRTADGMHNVVSEQVKLKNEFRAGTISVQAYDQKISALEKEYNVFIKENARLTKELSNLKREMSAVSGTATALEKSATGNGKAWHNDFSGGIRSATGVSLEFTRILQDLPYGMQGVANNLQQLFTNWGYYTTRVREAAAAQGQVVGTGALLRGAITSMISPANLLTLGVSLLTAGWVYYEKQQQKANKSIKEGKSETEKYRQELDDFVQSLDTLNRVRANGTSEVSNEISLNRTLYALATDNTVALNERISAVKQLKREFPSYYNDLSNESILAGQAADAYRRLNTELLATGRARAAMKLQAESFEEIVKLDIRREKRNAEQVSAQEKLARLTERVEKSLGISVAEGKSLSEVLQAAAANLSGESNPYIDEIAAASKLESQIKSISDARLEDFTRYQELNKDVNTLQKSIISSVKSGAKLTKDEAESTKKIADNSDKIAKSFASALSSLQGMSSSASGSIDIMVRSGLDADDEATKQKYDDLGFKAGQSFLEGLKNAAGDPAKIAAITDAYDNAMADIETQRATEHEKNAEKYKETEVKTGEYVFQYQRRLNESLSQILIRRLNAETKLKVEAAKGDNEKLLQLQQNYWKQMEAIQQRDRQTNIQLAFDGDALSVPLANIRSQMDEVRQSFEQGGLSVLSFQQKISDLEVQRQQLQLWQGTVDNISGACGNLYADAIFNTENAIENLGKAFENTAKSIISGLIKIAVRYAINQAIGTSSMAATAAASSATAATVAASWATAAALVSAATFGANAAAGGGALAALIASTKALSGFSRGGYTGNYRRNEIAGVVHGQEYVINASATRENLPLLRAINAGVDVSGFMPNSTSVIKYGSISNNPVMRHEVVVRGEFDGKNMKIVQDVADQEFGRYFR